MKITSTLFFWSIFTFLFVSCNAGSVITLVENGKSDYVIVLPEEPQEYEMKAALELQYYLKQMTGVEIPVMSDDLPASEFEIIIGKSDRIESSGIKIDDHELEEDGFIIRTKDTRLFIVGGSRKGALYGVYTFLEDYLGCRKYTPDLSYIPTYQSIILKKIKDKQVPDFKQRYLYFPGSLDQDFCDWHKINSRMERQAEWGMWVHTFKKLVPAKEYFRDHPEYFSDINGIRIPNGQLCLTNQEVFDTLVSALHEKTAKRPNSQYWSVSQNDNFMACQCENCLSMNEMYGGPSGIIIDFVNHVAADFPDKTISTLAYQYSRKAPEGIRPAANVNIMLCTIECNRSKPISKDPSGISFRKDIHDWGKLTDNILLWDYVVQFRNYISPFPNLRVLQPNIQFFRDNNVSMMFQQGSGTSYSEFAELRTYLIAKLLWDPDADADALLDDFIYNFYGDAAPYIRQYIDIMHDALETSSDGLSIYGYPYDGIDSYLTPVLIREYSYIFDMAQQAVAEQAVFAERVKTARLPLEFAILDISLRNVDEDLSYYYLDDGKWRIRFEMTDRLYAFADAARSAGIERLQEGGTTPDEYTLQVMKYINISMLNPLALDKPASILTTYSEKYDVGGATALTDGLRGTSDYHYNWLGFEGNDLEAVIDLEEVTQINRISTDFLQNNFSWIFLPKRVLFYISENGLDFEPVGIIENNIPDDVPGIFTETFFVRVDGSRARYVKIYAESKRTCPEWHIGSGEPAWIFVDEVIVE